MISVVLFIMPDGQWQSLTDVPSSQHRNDRQAIHKSQCLQGDLLPGGSQVSLPGRFIRQNFTTAARCKTRSAHIGLQGEAASEMLKNSPS
jgi:hypothetical protein